MANSFKLTSQVATNAMLALLVNNLVWGKHTNKKYNRYFGDKEDAKGDTITIRRAQEFVTRTGATFDAQDIVTGSSSVIIDTQRGVDFSWQPTERELKVDSLLEDSILRGKMAALAQAIESDVANAAKEFSSWVGTPGQLVNSATDFLKAPQRLDEFAVAPSDRVGILPPADFYGIGGSFTTQTFFGNNINDPALRKMKLPMIGSVQPEMAQTSLSITTGTRVAADSLGIRVAGANQNVNYATVKDGYTQTLDLEGLDPGSTISKGEIFTIAGVFAVNPRTKVSLGYLQEFVVMADATADSTGIVELTIANPIIAATGAGTTLLTNTAFQTVSAAPANDAAVTFFGAASTTYNLPCVYHRDAIALSFVKPSRPYNGEFSYATDPVTGVTIRVWAFSDGTNDVHSYRCDVLYGVNNIDRRLGTKLSGTA